MILATDRRLLLYRGNRWRVGVIQDLITELPRRTRIGAASGLWHRTDIFGERLYIQARWHRQVELADQAPSAAAAPRTG